MTSFLNNYYISCKLEGYNIYNNKNNNIFFMVIPENTTFNIHKNKLNKKIYTLIFWRGNKGNKGNIPFNVLNFQQSHIPTLGVFNSPYSPFPFCRVKNVSLFFSMLAVNYGLLTKINKIESYLQINAYFSKKSHILANGFLFLQLLIDLNEIERPPDKLPIGFILSIFEIFFKEFCDD